MKNSHKFRSFCLILAMCGLLFNTLGVCAVTDTAGLAMSIPKEKIVVVIDPGHGGDNLGTEVGATIEKEMTMVTAKAMYDELCRYDNVDVYLTHTDDKDMSLKERAQFAQSVGAHYLFSIHYNASEEHTLFGSEVWISSIEPYHSEGVRFGAYHLLNMQDKGLFIRGIKTRLNDKGTDYYGIIRECVDLDITASIIEHCHVDEDRDIPFCDTEDKWREFGVEDAKSVAQFLGLSSKELNVDYNNYRLPEEIDLAELGEMSFKDFSEPDLCEVTLDSRDEEQAIVQLTVSGNDHDTPLLYYDYSYDGGFTYSKLMPWPECNALSGKNADSFQLEIQVPFDKTPVVIVRAYNMYHAFTESNHLTLEAFHEPVVTPEPTEEPEIASPIREIRENHPALKALEVTIGVFAVLFVITAGVVAVKSLRRK